MSTLRERIASDAGKFSNTSLLGSSAVYTATGTTTTRNVSVVYCPPYSQTDLFDGESVNVSPIAFVAESEVELPAKGDTFKIGTVTYYVQKVEPNGIGMNVVKLSKQATHG